MHTKMLYALSQKAFIGLDDLLMGHTVFSVARVIHNIVSDGKMSTRVIAAAYGLRNISHFLQKVDVGNIIQIDNSTKVIAESELINRRIV